MDRKTEAQKWKKELQRLRRNEKAREKRRQERERRESGWRGSEENGKTRKKLENELRKIWRQRTAGKFVVAGREIAGARDILQKFENLKKQHEWNFNL